MGIICACLPTLGPIFQESWSPESLINSVKGYFQMRSRSKSSVWSDNKHKDSMRSGKSSVRDFRERPEDAVILTNVWGRRTNDTENGVMPVEGIFVQTKMSTSDEGGRYSAD